LPSGTLGLVLGASLIIITPECLKREEYK